MCPLKSPLTRGVKRSALEEPWISAPEEPAWALLSSLSMILHISMHALPGTWQLVTRWVVLSGLPTPTSDEVS